MSGELYVSFTMDVERPKPLSPTGGPESWTVGAVAVQSFCAALEGFGYPATLFVVPDAMEHQSSLFLALRRRGHECGLHLHPQSWRDRYLEFARHDYLGGYDAQAQRELLTGALRHFESAAGFRPRVFRPGNFSANDSTFAVLESLGFVAGSVSQPGRCAPAYKATWVGADRSVHRGHGAFRHVAGDLRYVEVPGTTDSTRVDHWTGVGDARIEEWDAPDILAAVEDSLRWQIQHASPIKHVCLFTHNTVSYDPADSDTRYPVLAEVIRRLPAAAARFELTLRPGTITGIRDALASSAETPMPSADTVLPVPRPSPVS